MAVAFDVAGLDAASNFGVTSCTTASFTIAATADRAALLVLGMAGNSSTGFTSSCAGTSGSAVSGTDSASAVADRILAHQVIAPASGSQTATMSWTTAQDALLQVMVFNGVDQTNPFTNGNVASNSTGSPTIAPTGGSGAGNLSAAGANGYYGAVTGGQTTRVAVESNGSHQLTVSTHTAGSTHSWADGFAEWAALAVHVQEPQLPVFTLQPVDQVVADGGTISFDTTVTNVTSYQWETLAPLGGSWGNVSGGSGATSADYTTGTLSRSSDAGRFYRLKATNSNGDTYSSVVSVRVTDIPASYDFGGFVIGANS